MKRAAYQGQARITSSEQRGKRESFLPTQVHQVKDSGYFVGGHIFKVSI